MRSKNSTFVVMRRPLLGLAAAGLMAGHGLAAPADTEAADDGLVHDLFGRAATASPLVHLVMPPVFGDGYSVPMEITVDSPMTASDHVRMLHVLAPENPIIAVANFTFSPASGRAAITTRIRLAAPQHVIAVAELHDGQLLMARTWVEVVTNGCD